MNTLRWRLTLSLWAALALVGGGSAIFVYTRAARETQSLLDYQLQQAAHLAAARSIDASLATTGPAVDPESDREEDVLVVVRDSGGHVLYSNAGARAVPPAPHAGFAELSIAGEGYRVFGLDTRGLRVTVAQSLEVRHEAALAVALAALLPVVLLIPILAIVMGVAIRRVLRPLDEAVRVITVRPALALDSLPSAGLPDDLRPLIDEINRLLERLRAAMQHERQFLADATHALRTPITALQLQVDVFDSCKDAAERDARLTELRQGIRRVGRLAHHLLTLAADTGAAASAGPTTMIDELLQEAQALYAPAATALGVTLEMFSEVEGEVQGELRQLLLVLGNLLENAVRYSPARSAVRLRATESEAGVTIEITDEGPGLPESELERVFERFYRAAATDDGGSGLGLATVRAVARQIGARVTLRNRSDRTGLRASVELRRPAAAELTAAAHT